MKTKTYHRIIALLLCLAVPLIPEAGYAATTEGETKISPEDVTENDVIEKTENTTTYNLGDGEKMTVFHGGQVRYEDENGNLKDYDRSLVEIEEGETTGNNKSLTGYKYENSEGDKKHYIPEKLSEETPIILENGEYSIAIGPSDATLEANRADNINVSLKTETTPTIYEDEEELPLCAEYESLDSKAGFTYESEEAGIKETLILKEKPESNIFSYVLDLNGLEPRKNPTDGGITFFDIEKDEIVADIEPAWMNDASGNAYSEEITYDIEEDSENPGKYILTMTIDQDYLDSADRQYPVTIDPTTTWTGSTQVRDAYVLNGKYADRVYYSSGIKHMPAGKNTNGTHRTYIFFLNLKTKMSGQSISSAKFTVYETGNGASGQKISAYRVLKSWKASKLTWNNKPTRSTSALSTITTKKTMHSAHTFDLKTFVRGLANNTYSNHGIVLINNSSGYASFRGSRYGTSTYRPKLVVVHYSKPTTATAANISPRYVKDSTTAKITYSGITSTGLARCEYRVYEYNDSTSSSGSIKLDYSSSRPITSGANLPSLENGCYHIYVRGVNTAGVAGTGKSAGVVHVDNQAPVLGTITLSASTEAKPGPANPVLTWKNISDAHLKDVSVSVDDGAYKKIGDEASGTYTIPRTSFDSTGYHTVKVKATDKMDNSSEKTFENYYVCLDGPEFGTLTLKDSSGKAIKKEDWTAENNPKIEFSGVTDEKSVIEDSGVQYAIKEEGSQPEDTDFIAPADLVITNESGIYSGSFRPVESDRNLSNGSRNIYVRFTNEAGNYTQKSLEYNLDRGNPSGSITITSPSGTDVTGALSDTVIITGVITDKQNTEDTNYSGIKDSSIRVYKQQEGGQEEEIDILYKETSISTTRAFDTTKHDNGIYILKLNIEDNAGNKKTVTREISIANRIAGPEVTAEKNENGISLEWSWTKTVDLAKVQYKIGEDGSWTDIANSSSLQGSTLIGEPADENVYTIYVRGVDSSGTEGEAAEVSYTVDKTSPQADITGFVQGVVSGKAKDSALQEWKIEIKSSASEDATYTEVLNGNKNVDGEFGFIDLSSSDYIAGQSYTLRLTAADESGNISTAYKEITRDEDKYTAQTVEPGFRIKRPAGQGYSDPYFRIGTQTESLTLKNYNASGTVSWYVDGVTKAIGNIYEDDFSGSEGTSYSENTDYDILAIDSDGDENRQYSRAVTINGNKQELDFDGEPDLEKNVAVSGKAVAVRISGPTESSTGKSITYKIKTGDGQYLTLTPDEKAAVSQIDNAGIYASDFTVKVETEASAEEIGEIIFTADTLADESFSISVLENYRPVDFSVRQQLNYKTYFSWQMAAGQTEIPDDISFEVYRSTEKGFTPSADTLVASDFASQSYTEINTGYGGKYYYRVRAVRKDDEDNVLSSSGYSKQIYGRVVDADEYTKRLGVKEYWSYASMGLPQGDAKIEKSEGNFTYSQTDAQIPNEGVDVSFERTYNSRSTAKSSLGTGWSSSFDMEVLGITDESGENEDSLVLRYGDGTIYNFVDTRSTGSEPEPDGEGGEQGGEGEEGGEEESADIEYISSMGKYVTLTKTHCEEEVSLPVTKVGIVTGDDKETVTVISDYTVKNKAGNEYRFNSFGKLVYMAETNGNFAILEYGQENGLLSKVRTNRNLSMEITYNDGEDGKDPLTIDKVSLPDGSSFEYDYAGSADKENVRLVSVTHKPSSGTGAITYRYDYKGSSEPKLDSIKDGKGNKYSVSYDSKGRAYEMSDPEGKSQKLTYSDSGYETKTETVIQKGLLSGDEVISEETDRFDGWFGNCVESIDAAGNKTGYTYKDNLLVMTETEGQYQKVDSATGNVIISDKTDVQTTAYDPKTDNAVRERGEDGSITRYRYEGDNVSREVVYNGDGEKTSDLEYDYDKNDNEIRSFDNITESEGLTEYFNTDSATGLAGEVKKETSKEAGNTLRTTSYTYKYSDNGNKTERSTEVCDGVTTVTTTVTDVMGREISTSVSVDGDVISETTNTYDGFGRLIGTVTVQGEFTSTTSSTYDDNGTVVSETDKDGTVTTYTYDKLNRVTSRNVSKGSLSKTWSTEYSYQDIQLNIGDEEIQAENTYVVTEKNPDNYVTSEAYTDPLGNTVREKSGGMYVDRLYDKSGNLMVSYEFGENSDGEGGLLTLSVYDETGNKTHTALNPQATGGVYNIGGDCIVTENTYDADSNLISSKDAEGIKTEFSYNQEGQLTKVKQPGNTVTSFAYSKGLEGGGSKVTTTDAKGNKSSVKTSARGLDESITDYIEGETVGIKRTFQYDGEGNVVKEKELEGNYKTYAYDDKGRNTEIKYHKADGTETLKSTFEYNINDEIILMQDYEKTDGNWNLYRSEKYTYDALNRMVSYKEWNGAQEPEQLTASYTYDIEGNVTRVDYSDPDSDLEALIFTYSGSKKLLKIKADTGKLLNDTVREYEYDEQGRASLIKDHYDFAGNGSYLEKSYTYDSFGRVTSMTYKGGSSHNEVKEAYTYTYDRNSNITSERIVSNYSTGSSGDGTDKTREYTYDSLGRLVETNITDNKSEDDAETITYTYDVAGNRLTETKGGKTVSYTYNGLNQLTEAAETGNVTRTYSYDGNGNQSVEVTKEGDSETLRRTFAYDEGNRLKKLTVKEGETVTLTQENRYNGDGQRIRKKETKPGSGTGGDPAEVKQTDYFYQDGAVLYTEDANGNRTSMNLLGGSGNIIATSRTAGNTENWYLYNKDIRESTSSITGADGNPAATYEYDDFGNTEITGGVDFYNEICYTGQVYDVSSGLYYYNARYYDPNNGRFITQDTYRGESSTPDTLHLYAYCANNPINYVDPSGHDAIVLKSNFVNEDIGHLAVLIETKTNWKYFSWAGPKEGWKTEFMGRFANTKKYKSVRNGKVHHDINRRFKRLAEDKRYEKYLYIKGDFSNSSTYIDKVKRGESYKKYSLTGRNCAWMVLQVLKKGDIGKAKRKKIHKMQYEKILRKGDLVTKVRTIIPNTAFGKIADIFGVTTKRVKGIKK